MCLFSGCFTGMQSLGTGVFDDVQVVGLELHTWNMWKIRCYHYGNTLTLIIGSVYLHSVKIDLFCE